MPRRTKKTTRSPGSSAKLPPINKQAAAKVCDFFPVVLRHSKGAIAGQPFDLLPWQKTVLSELFGRLNPDGTRVRRVGYIEVPKKNGKSTLLAGIALYLLVADSEPGAEIYGAAADREQASIIYREAAAMVRASPSLSKHCEVIDSRKTIFVRATNSFYRVLSADAFRAEGLNIHGLLFDELHAQRDRRLWDCLRYGGASRRQPVLLSISTAGYDRKSICWEQHQYAERVIADPMLDPGFYGCIYGCDHNAKDFDISKKKFWYQANPSLGHTITEESFAADVKEAQNSPAKLSSFLRYRMDCWLTAESRFFNLQKWSACRVEPHDMTGRACYLGLDLASTTDLTAAVIVSEDDDGVLDVVPFFWCPSESIEQRSLRDKVDYIQWAKDGHIRVTDGNATDYETIKQDILSFCDQFGVKQIGVDPWNATMLSQSLAAEGADIVNVRQGYGTLSAPMKRLEALVLDGKLRCNHPIMDWCAANCAVQSDHQGNIKPSKAKSTERIDGIAALVTAMAVQAAAETPPPEQDWNIISV